MKSTNQHPIVQSITLHLLPGIMGAIVYVLITPFLIESGYPSLLGILIAAALVILPIEVFILFYRARLSSGTFSLKNIVRYREGLPKWQYVVIPLVLVIWGFLAGGIAPLLDNVILKAWFSWLPEWFTIFNIEQLQSYARPALLVTFWTGLIVNGILLPFVEELYFRGYLLPGIERFGKWAPLLNVSLFSLYHFWTPWQIFSRILLVFPWVYIAWRKRNIYLIIIAHCTANILGWLLTWGLVFR